MHGPEGFDHMYGYFSFGHGLWMLVLALFLLVPFWRICQRAGFSGWLSLLILVPMLNIALLYYLAFAEWPSNRE